MINRASSVLRRCDMVDGIQSPQNFHHGRRRGAAGTGGRTTGFPCGGVMGSVDRDSSAPPTGVDGEAATAGASGGGFASGGGAASGGASPSGGAAAGTGAAAGSVPAPKYGSSVA